MHLPYGMAIAVFDTLETSYMSAITLSEYFEERKLGLFSEGQSIREQSSSVLRGHTIWDAFEYRLSKVFEGDAISSDVALQLARKISGLAALNADTGSEDNFTLDRALCQSFILDALSEIEKGTQFKALSETEFPLREVSINVSLVWEDILWRLHCIVSSPAIQIDLLDKASIICLEKLGSLRFHEPGLALGG